MKESDKIEQTKDSGMDLRDYFAARAMPFIAEGLKQIWLAEQCFEGWADTEINCIANASYDMADEMMKVRK
jgi:hypothetical protein